MSIQSSPTHNHPLPNSVPRTHHHHPNLTTTITPSIDNEDDDDVVFLCSVPKVIHTPEEYDSKCKCSTCKLVRRLLAECTCEECRGQQQTNQVNQTEGQVVQSSENVTIQVSPPNVQPSESSIQNNDASTSEHTNANDLDDDRESRSSTPDYHPRFFDDESGDSSSDDCEDDDSVDDGDDDRDDKELDQNSETEVDHDSSDPDYTLPSTSKPVKKSHTKSSLYVGKRKLAGNRTASVAYHQTTGGDESNSSQIESDDNQNDSDSEQINSFECPKCESNFDERNKLVWHYRFVHLQWKPFYCKWLKCDFVGARQDRAMNHVYRKHLNMRNLKEAKRYVGKRELSISSQEDPVYESIQDNTSYNCSKCGRNFTNGGHYRRHLVSHNKSGFRCTWHRCGFFFSERAMAKKHVLREHFKDKLVNETQISKHLVKVDPKLVKSNCFKNNYDESIIERMNRNDQDDNRESRSSTQNYLPRFFDDESGDSSSDDTIIDSEYNCSVVGAIDQNDKESDQESESNDEDDNSSDPDYVFDDDEDDTELDQETESDDSDDNDDDPDYEITKPSSSKPLKEPVNRSSQPSKHAKTVNTENSHKCRLCNQSFSTKRSLERHDHVIHQQAKSYYCKWPKCDYSTDRYDSLNEHITRMHFNHRKNSDKARVYFGKRETFAQFFDCPKCDVSFTFVDRLIRHYRALHHEWKPYYCRWPKCHFVSGRHDTAVCHVNRRHFNSRNKQKARKYVEKREGTPPRDPVFDQIVAIKFAKKRAKPSKSVCPKCGRNIPSRYLAIHLRIHKKPGYRCTWPNCGFFFANLPDGKKHVCADHLQVETANPKQINQHLIKVNPRTGETRKVPVRHGIIKNSNSPAFDKNCPKCGRNFRNKGLFRRHFRIHAKSGFRCTWPQCGFFFSDWCLARKHILKEHFTDKMVNSIKINEHLVKVDPQLDHDTSRIDTSRMK